MHVTQAVQLLELLAALLGVHDVDRAFARIEEALAVAREEEAAYEAEMELRMEARFSEEEFAEMAF